MKKTLTILFKLCILSYVVMLFTLCSCEKHNHSYESYWSMNENYHFHKCVGCEEITNKEAHIWNDEVVTIEPTETIEGKRIYTCTVCEKTKVEKIDKLPHQHKYPETYITDEKYHWNKCVGCEEITDKETHTWNGGIVTIEATETIEGEKTYTCTICQKEKVEKIDKLPHQHKYPETSITDETYHWNKCEGCEEITDKEAHIWDNGVVTIEATDTIEGEKTYTCTVCEKRKVEKIDKIKGLKYELSDTEDSYVVTGLGTCEDTDIVIPEVYKDLPVTSIGYAAFYECSNLTSIVIPQSVRSIEKIAFLGCKNLTNVVIPKGVVSIGYAAFLGCYNLTDIVIPESVTSIGTSAFNGCISLTSIDIPESVTTIDSFAFAHCSNLTSITIPNSVTSVGEYAFEGCSNLTIYCEVSSKPNRWDYNWNTDNRPVIWGYKK